jgi:hypothetical protein
MAKKDPYSEFLKQDFSSIFEELPLKDLQKRFLSSRWLDQVIWMEAQAGKARDRYYVLRLLTIIGGVVLPGLVSLNITGSGVKTTLVWITFGLSQVVATSAAIEEFFHYGERWRHYRRTVESLKTQGWHFFELSGPYDDYVDHEKAFTVFAKQVEDIIQRDVEVYATQIVQEKKEKKEKKEEEKTQNGQDQAQQTPSFEIEGN